MKYFIGLMSGTSMDGVDAVLVRMDGSRFSGCLKHAFVPYPDTLKADLIALQTPHHDELHRAAILAQTVSKLYIEAVRAVLADSGMHAEHISALGCHGQTVRHRPDCAYTLQLIDGARIAAQTGIDTVCDFRSGDMAMGGQGAPLTPAFHRAVFGSTQTTRAVLNLGGIANLSVLHANGQTIGFDTGPANMLADEWTAKHFGQPFDDGGRIARRGKVLPDLLAALSAHDYFRQPAPKSTGRDLFSQSWLATFLTPNMLPEDVLATLFALSARTAADAINHYAADADAVYLCGGGALNPLLRENITQALHPNIALKTTDDVGLPVQLVEAAAFAWLAAWRVAKQPVPLNSITGARGNVPAGCIYAA